jgi:hypothetical protein
MESPFFVAIWLSLLSTISVGVSTIKNKKSALKFIAIFNHAIEVLSLAVAQLQTVVNSASAEDVAKVAKAPAGKQDAFDEDRFMEMIRRIIS